MTFCPGCFNDTTFTICECCGYDQTIERSSVVLRHLTKLNHEHYLIGRVLGEPGGFGITYLGWDLRLKKLVAIKEFLPRNIATRQQNRPIVEHHTTEDADEFSFGLKRFLEEARTLAQLDHPNIVRVRDYFEENGTGYLVMDYYDGMTLSEFMERHEDGKISVKLAIEILMPVLDGLKEVHAKGFLHRDIKPQNIYLTTGNRPILLDFGAARQAMGERHSSMSVVLSEGYAPIEQYQRGSQQGPWTDVYGAASTLYTMMTGKQFPGPLDRIHDASIHLELPPTGYRYANAITEGLAIEPGERTQSINQFQLNLLKGSGRYKLKSFSVLRDRITDALRGMQIPSFKRYSHSTFRKPRLVIVSTIIYYFVVLLGLYLGAFERPSSFASITEQDGYHHAIALLSFYLVPLLNVPLRSRELSMFAFWACLVTQVFLPTFKWMNGDTLHSSGSFLLSLLFGLMATNSLYVVYSALKDINDE